MKKITKLLMSVLFICVASGASASTFYAKAVAHGQSGRGKVYVSKTETTPASADFNTDSELTNSGSGGNSVGTVNFYLYAQPEPGYVLRCWSDKADGTGDALSTANPYAIEISSSIKDENAANIPTKTYYAIFDREPTVSVKAEPADLGLPSMSTYENSVGDEITLHGTAANELYDWAGFTRKYGKVPNKYIQFVRWKNSAGETVSTDKDYTFTITEENKGVYTAEYEVVSSIDGPGYYRVWTGADAMVRVAGKVALRLSSSNVCVLTDVGLVCNPYGSYESVGSGTNNIYNDPSGIIYISGTAGATTAYESDKNVISDATLSGQGVNSKEFFPNNTINIQWHSNPGYYKLVSSGASLKHLFNSNVAYNTGYGTIVASSNQDGPENQFEVNKVCRETMDRDRYWFGACPDESMSFDGGYWESMYTAFPYELVGEDGHEAYIVSGYRVENDVTVLSLRKIGNGIVPANTAVLIKCQAPADLTEYMKGNGLTPQNRLIPIEPGDSRIDASVADGNLLKGVIQLNTVAIPAKTEVTNDYADEGYTRFDGAGMRVFGVNGEGKVGFYKLEENAVMKSNRVYLDMTQLNAEAKAASRMRMEVDALDQSGIAGPGIPAGTEVETEYYTIQGFRVDHPVEGQLYIQRRGASVRKIIY